jgi:serine/threonine-protein kinase
MGEVWRAKDTRFDRSVFIKVLPAELAQNAQLKIRFEREARAISQFNRSHLLVGRRR